MNPSLIHWKQNYLNPFWIWFAFRSAIRANLPYYEMAPFFNNSLIVPRHGALSISSDSKQPFDLSRSPWIYEIRSDWNCYWILNWPQPCFRETSPSVVIKGCWNTDSDFPGMATILFVEHQFGSDWGNYVRIHEKMQQKSGDALGPIQKTGLFHFQLAPSAWTSPQIPDWTDSILRSDLQWYATLFVTHHNI